jgi:hypothetical protein
MLKNSWIVVDSVKFAQTLEYRMLWNGDQYIFDIEKPCMTTVLDLEWDRWLVKSTSKDADLSYHNTLLFLMCLQIDGVTLPTLTLAKPI